jgi:hypothetical protein
MRQFGSVHRLAFCNDTNLDKVPIHPNLIIMLTNLRGLHLITVLALTAASASNAFAFEQGNYFIFDIVDSKEVKPIQGRLAVPAEALVTVKIEPHTAIQTEKRSEFETDFTKTIRPQSTNNMFELDIQVEATPEPENTSFSTDSFDLGRSDTVFGQ